MDGRHPVEDRSATLLRLPGRVGAAHLSEIRMLDASIGFIGRPMERLDYAGGSAFVESGARIR